MKAIAFPIIQATKKMAQRTIIKAPVGWMLLKYKKVQVLGVAPYYFMAGWRDQFPVRFISGWDANEGGSNDEESHLGEDDKLEFIRLFNKFYPAGIVL